MPAQRSTQQLLVSAGPSKESSSLAGGLLHSLRNWSHIHQLLWYYIFNILLCSQFFNVLKNYDYFCLYVGLVISGFYPMNGDLAHPSVSKLDVELHSVSKELKI